MAVKLGIASSKFSKHDWDGAGLNKIDAFIAGTDSMYCTSVLGTYGSTFWGLDFRSLQNLKNVTIKDFSISLTTKMTKSSSKVSLRWITNFTSSINYVYCKTNSGSYDEEYDIWTGSVPDYSTKTIWASDHYPNTIVWMNENLDDLINGYSTNSFGARIALKYAYVSDITVTLCYTYEVDDPKYTVTYNGNGATSGSVSPQSGVAVGSDLTLQGNAFEKKYAVTLNSNYSGAGNTILYSSAAFNGWEDRGNITATNGEYFTYSQFDAPYYANTYGDLYNAFKYNKLSLADHYVNYGRNEGRSCTGTPRGVYPAGATVNTLSTTSNDTVALYAQWSDMSAVTLPVLERDGYNFLGWYTAASGGAKVNNSYVPTGIVTLYAQWQIKSYSLTVTAQTGGTVTGGGTYEHGATATLTAIPNDGYEFKQWSDGNTDPSRTVTVTENTAYTAIFEESDTSPKIVSAAILYSDRQVSESNKVPAGQGYIIQIEIE